MLPEAPVAVVILTYNEALNLPHALASVKGWANEIFVLDSFSEDETVAIAERAGCSVVRHEFVDYAKQRNFAITALPILSEWILFLDADERLPDELKEEISRVLSKTPAENGFYLNRRLLWMGRWIRRGYYPSWILRLFRRGKGRCEDRSVNEHLIVEGETGQLRNDFLHDDKKGMSDWIRKHRGYAEREALELLKTRGSSADLQIDAALFGTQAQRKRWLRHKVWNRMPPLIRPMFYFVYRYFLTGGFLDGKEALVYHTLHAFWYPMLIDVKYIELRRNL